MFRYLASVLAVILTAFSSLQAQDTTRIGDRSLLWERAALGQVPGVTYFVLTGVNPAIAATYEAAWQESAAYTPLAAAMSTPYCASSSANDAAAGTGARTISVPVITTAFSRVLETVTLNGQTSVNLATANVLFIEGNTTVLTAGSSNLNEGIIQCGTGANTAGDPAVSHSYLPVSSLTAAHGAGVGGGNSAMSFFKAVPLGRKTICRNFQIGSVFATAASSVGAVIDTFTNLSLVFQRPWVKLTHATGSNVAITPDYVVFPEKTLIVGKLNGPTGSNVGPAFMSAECLEIDLSSADQKVF